MVNFIEEDQFGGVSTFKIDAKGRVSMPVEFRNVLRTRLEKFSKNAVLSEGDAAGSKKKKAKDADENEEALCLVMTRGVRTPHIECYPLDVWNKTKEWLRNLEENDETNDLRIYILGHREVCEIDKLGRVLISQELREFAGIGTGDVMVMGVGETFRIWSKETYDRHINVKNMEVRMGELKSKYSKKREDA
jgi:MraZ protein